MKCNECGGETNRGENVEYAVGESLVEKRFVCTPCLDQMSAAQNEAEQEIAQCSYCFVWGHTAEECPEQPMETCTSCGEDREDVHARQSDEVMCDQCWEAALDHGFMHVPEAFTCEVCGEERRSAVQDARGRVICAECRRAQ